MRHMRLHYSKKPIEALFDRPQIERNPTKPTGLWYSPSGPDDWKSWCEAEGFDGLGPFQYALTIDPACTIIKLRTPDDIFCFNDQYSIELPYGIMEIDWKRVADDYDGIEIAPYQWKCRLDTRVFWYYGWDCASGCLWRPKQSTLKELACGPTDIAPSAD